MDAKTVWVAWQDPTERRWRPVGRLWRESGSYRFGYTIGATECYQSTANSSGATGLLHALGSNSVADNDVTLVASLLPLNSFGYFLTSRSAGLATMPGGSQGDLCLGGNIGRFSAPSQIRNTGALGRFSLAIDLASLPTPTGPVAALPGETWFFQAWHRDANPALTSNFTDAVEVLLQ